MISQKEVSHIFSLTDVKSIFLFGSPEKKPEESLITWTQKESFALVRVLHEAFLCEHFYHAKNIPVEMYKNVMHLDEKGWYICAKIAPFSDVAEEFNEKLAVLDDQSLGKLTEEYALAIHGQFLPKYTFVGAVWHLKSPMGVQITHPHLLFYSSSQPQPYELDTYSMPM